MIHLRMWFHEKLTVISSPKVASRYLDSVFYQNKNDGNLFVVKDNFYLNHIKTSISDISECNIDLLFSNKNKKDILLLYRHPEQKLFSGLIQDFNSIIKNNNNDYNFLVNYYFNDTLKFKDFSSYSSEKIDNILKNDTRETNPEFYEYYATLLEIYIKFHINNNIFTYHASPNLYLLYSLINEKIHDKNKLYLLDIDSCSDTTLENFLLKYEITPKNEKILNSNKSKINLINNVILKDKIIKKKINENLKSEIFFYNLLSKQKQNIT